MTLTFTTDGDGFGRSLSDGTNTTKFLYDWQSGTPGLDPVLVETDGAGTTTTRYTHGLGLVSQRRANVSKWYIFEAIWKTKSRK